MQVDTAQLRKAAGQLRQDVAKQLAKAADGLSATVADGTFDQYTTATPYREAMDAWLREIGLLAEATAQLAGALEQAADGYDTADARSAGRLTAPK
jgi:uncharacterized protein YukE